MTDTIETIVNLGKNAPIHHYIIEGETVDGVECVLSGSYETVGVDGNVIKVFDGDGEIIAFNVDKVSRVNAKTGDVYLNKGTVVTFI